MSDYFKPLPINHKEMLEEARRSYDRLQNIDDIYGSETPVDIIPDTWDEDNEEW